MLRSSRTLGFWLWAAIAGGLLGCDKPAEVPDSASGGPSTGGPTPVTTTSGAPAPTDATPPAPTVTTSQGAGSPTGTTSAAPAPTTPQEPGKSSTPELRFAGTWSSPSCGDRTYERRLTLRDDKTFRAEERVSPCPPKVACVWSGILYWQGTVATDEKGVVLTKTGGAESGRGAKIESPLKLEVDKGSGALVEVRGGARCPYTRAPEGASSTTTKGSEPPPPSGPANQ